MPVFPINYSLFRADFDPRLFEQMIKNHGKRLLWSRAQMCPDVIGDEDSGRHKLDCETCDGSGWVYDTATEIRGVAQGIKESHVFRAEGRFDMGDLMVTTPAEVDINLWDKLTTCFTQARYRENLQRNSQSLTDRPRYDVLSVNRLFSPLGEFTAGQHFVVDDGQIRWLDPSYVAVSDVYAIDYNYHPIFIVVDMPNEIRNTFTKEHPTSDKEQFEKLPKRCMCRRDFIVRDETKDVRD